MSDSSHSVSDSGENRAVLQKALEAAIKSETECSVCFENLSEKAVITQCRHAFCLPCIAKTIALQKKCPLCRRALKHDDLVERAGDPPIDPEVSRKICRSIREEAAASRRNRRPESPVQEFDHNSNAESWDTNTWIWLWLGTAPQL